VEKIQAGEIAPQEREPLFEPGTENLVPIEVPPPV
jgi:hypothetical protein